MTLGATFRPGPVRVLGAFPVPGKDEDGPAAAWALVGTAGVLGVVGAKREAANRTLSAYTCWRALSICRRYEPDVIPVLAPFVVWKRVRNRQEVELIISEGAVRTIRLHVFREECTALSSMRKTQSVTPGVLQARY